MMLPPQFAALSRVTKAAEVVRAKRMAVESNGKIDGCMLGVCQGMISIDEIELREKKMAYLLKDLAVAQGALSEVLGKVEHSRPHICTHLRG